MRTVAVDFDGVIHSYDKGWHDGTVYGEPVAGSLEALRFLLQRFAVFIHTTRDPDQVADWLAPHGFRCWVEATPGSIADKFWNRQGMLLVTSRKLPAVAYIDDRGIRFQDWEQALADLDRYEP